MSPQKVFIHYLRPPDRLRIYEQRVVDERKDVIVTLSEPVQSERPLTEGGDVLLEKGSVVVWFTFPGRWHDIGRFHRADGTFSGLYANVLTPCEIVGDIWRTTDLFLDVWWPSAGQPVVLDEDELEAALRDRVVDATTAARAREEATRLLAQAGSGAWPPAVVEEWTLEKAIRALAPE